MKDTACENCPFKEQGFKECPNYIETLWHKQGEPQPVIVKDCSPKRTLLMLHELHGRTFSLQQQINQAENQILSLNGNFNKMITAIQQFPKEKELERLE